MLIMESGKRQRTKGIELAIQERIRMLGEKENYVVHSISFQTFLYRHLKLRRLLKIQYVIAIHLMR